MLEVEPITGGRIFGPALNATVTGGVAYPSIFEKGKLQDAFITTYGTTSDGEAFFAQVTGIGEPTEQFSSIVSLLLLLGYYNNMELTMAQLIAIGNWRKIRGTRKGFHPCLNRAKRRQENGHC